MNEAITVARIRKNAREAVHVQLRKFDDGQPLFSVRVFEDAGGGFYVPGKTGIAFKIELLNQFADAVAAAVERAKAEGLIPGGRADG